jgi:heptosyltransferase-2
MKFLIVQTAFIGDVILATPLLEKLHRFYPEATIDILVRKGNESLLTGHPFVRNVLEWDKKQNKYGNLWRTLQQIRSERYDWIVNCQRFAASGLLTAFGGAGQTVGFDKNPFAFAFSRKVTHQIGDHQTPAHEVDRNLLLIRQLTDETFQKPRLYPTPAHTQKAATIAGATPYVCLAPTSVWFTKQLPAHKWVELIGCLPASTNVFLLGAPSDHAACEQIRLASGRFNVGNLAGQLNVLESAALMQHAVMNFVNDSAPLHLASAVDAPVTAFFCSTIPAFGFTPLSTWSRIVETTEPLPCRPCGLHGFQACPKGHFKCAETIQISVSLFEGTASS